MSSSWSAPSSRSSLRTPATYCQPQVLQLVSAIIKVQLENTCNWLSTSCLAAAQRHHHGPAWEHLQLIVDVMSCSWSAPSSRSSLRTPATDCQRHVLHLVSAIIAVQLENTCNWLSTSCLAVGQRHHHGPAWEHLQLIVKVMSCSWSAPSSLSSLRTPATDCQRHVLHLISAIITVPLENTCNWLSTSCLAVGQRHHHGPAWEHLQLIIVVMSCNWSAPSSRSTLRTPTTDCQRHIHIQKPCIWLSLLCPPWGHLQLITSVMSTLWKHATDCQCHEPIENTNWL